MFSSYKHVSVYMLLYQLSVNARYQVRCSVAVVFTRITVIVQVSQVSDCLSEPTSVGVTARQLELCL